MATATSRAHGANGDTMAEESKTDLDSLKSSISQLIESLMKRKDDVTDKAKAAMDKTQETVKARPLMSIIVVFLMGLVLGKIFWRS